VIIEQLISKSHIKEIHQIQNGRETVVHGVHFPDKKLPVRIFDQQPCSKKNEKVKPLDGHF